ncbi:MAG: sulfotransferase [Rubrivivax sp.]|nr:sulfotransferase [Rubrivivax sp.]
MTPVFLLGPGRSGTTLLYKLVAAMPDVGYLSNYNARFPQAPMWGLAARPVSHAFRMKRFAWFQDEGGAYFNDGRPWHQRIVPTPVEAEPVYRSCGMPDSEDLDRPLPADVVERLRRRFRDIAAAMGRSVVVSKRTANNRRVAQLLQAFPDARFVCLLRDGRAVARSLVRVHWWSDHTLFWCGRTPRSLVAEGDDELVLAARNWVEEMAVMEAGMRQIPAAQRMDLRYDDLLADPRACLTRVHAFMHTGKVLPAAYWELVDSLALRPTAADWLARMPAEERRSIEEVQRDTLQRWRFTDGDARPALPMWSSTNIDR